MKNILLAICMVFMFSGCGEASMESIAEYRNFSIVVMKSTLLGASFGPSVMFYIDSQKKFKLLIAVLIFSVIYLAISVVFYNMLGIIEDISFIGFLLSMWKL